MPPQGIELWCYLEPLLEFEARVSSFPQQFDSARAMIIRSLRSRRSNLFTRHGVRDRSIEERLTMWVCLQKRVQLAQPTLGVTLKDGDLGSDASKVRFSPILFSP